MKNIRKYISVCLMMLTICLVCSSTGAEAASAKWRKACKAYKSFLAKNESKFKVREGGFDDYNMESTKKSAAFLIVDLDKNGVPELVTQYNEAFRTRTLYVYTYKNGKVKRVKNGSIFASTYTSGGMSDGYTVYSCKKNHLHVRLGHGMGYTESVYRMKSGKVKLYAEHDHVKYIGDEYEVNGKSVSASRYKSAVKGCKRKNGIVKNKNGNRKKYVK